MSGSRRRSTPRFAALMPVETPEARQTQNHVVFLGNFADELQRKVPVAK